MCFKYPLKKKTFFHLIVQICNIFMFVFNYNFWIACIKIGFIYICIKYNIFQGS